MMTHSAEYIEYGKYEHAIPSCIFFLESISAVNDKLHIRVK